MAALGYQPYIKRGIRFSPVELRDIAIALVVLVFAFSLVSTGGLVGLLQTHDWLRYEYSLLVAALAVPTGFLLHELMHKITAQRYGCWAEFRMYPSGLLLAIVTAIVGYLFAAPGAVVISGMVNRKQHRNISAAGPGTNIAIGAILLGVGMAMGVQTAVFLGGYRYSYLVLDVAGVNLGLATFNLIPFGPLDGRKVLATDRLLYLGMLAASIGLLLYYLVVRGVISL